jgi:protein tyrosine phosphatase (PTP) superfamily phosphohydrolase (DUF442 family)
MACLVAILVLCITSDLSRSVSMEGNKPYPKRIPLEHVKNCIQVTEGIYSGGVPEGVRAFEELQRLGIKTILSVDGMKPDVSTAKKFHLQYVHLPHGYDGISTERLHEIAKGLQDLPKPIFIHCHHGKHRSPAATAAACVLLGWITSANATEVLKVAGTNPNYRGLFTTVVNAKPLSRAELSRIAPRFEEVAALPPLVETMVAMDEILEKLDRQAVNASNDPREYSDMADQVLLLTDHYTELHRTSKEAALPASYLEFLKIGELICTDLEFSLRSRASSVKPLVERLKSNCIDCHRQFRDNRSPGSPHP